MSYNLLNPRRSKETKNDGTHKLDGYLKSYGCCQSIKWMIEEEKVF